MPKIHPINVDHTSVDISNDGTKETLEKSGSHDVAMTTNQDQASWDGEQEVKSSLSLKDLTAALLAPAVYIEPRSEKNNNDEESEVSRRPTVERIDTQLKMKALKALKAPSEKPKFSEAPLAPISSEESEQTYSIFCL